MRLATIHQRYTQTHGKAYHGRLKTTSVQQWPWPQQTWVENWGGAVPLWEGTWVPI